MQYQDKFHIAGSHQVIHPVNVNSMPDQQLLLEEVADQQPKGTLDKHPNFLYTCTGTLFRESVEKMALPKEHYAPIFFQTYGNDHT